LSVPRTVQQFTLCWREGGVAIRVQVGATDPSALAGNHTMLEAARPSPLMRPCGPRDSVIGSRGRRMCLINL
jgi:hypothetical protein